jgi:hypothetical protein
LRITTDWSLIRENMLQFEGHATSRNLQGNFNENSKPVNEPTSTTAAWSFLVWKTPMMDPDLYFASPSAPRVPRQIRSERPTKPVNVEILQGGCWLYRLGLDVAKDRSVGSPAAATQDRVTPRERS